MAINPIKIAEPDHSIHELISARYSPYAFSPKPVEDDKLVACLEAARWAASSFNEQPWSFIIAARKNEAEFNKAIECLGEPNQAWAKYAGVIMLTVIKTAFTKNGSPNRVALHDLGLAAGNLTLQATALGLHVHQMAGVNLAKVRQTYDVPEGYEPQTAIALGYAADPAEAEDPAFTERDMSPRERKPLREFVFTGQWKKAAPQVNT
ncbi:MAG: nitroreductase family protein [Phycisphaeraceae bacterium]